MVAAEDNADDVDEGNDDEKGRGRQTTTRVDDAKTFVVMRS